MTTGRRYRPARAAFVALASCALAIAGCRDSSTAPEASVAFEESVVVRWNSAALEAVRRSRLGPPMVARALAVANTAMYDAWSVYDAKAIATRPGGAARRLGICRTRRAASLEWPGGRPRIVS